MISRDWYTKFITLVSAGEKIEPLKHASVSGNYGDWTTHLTSVVHDTCSSLGWAVAAKGFKCEVLPLSRNEYLGIDLMAFEHSTPSGWQFPIAAFELENMQTDTKVAYCLWKLLNIRGSARILFCYRKDWDLANTLIETLESEVIKTLPVQERADLQGEVMVVVGSRGESDGFPYGFFKPWYLDINSGRFVLG